MHAVYGTQKLFHAYVLMCAHAITCIKQIRLYIEETIFSYSRVGRCVRRIEEYLPFPFPKAMPMCKAWLIVWEPGNAFINLSFLFIQSGTRISNLQLHLQWEQARKNHPNSENGNHLYDMTWFEWNGFNKCFR